MLWPIKGSPSEPGGIPSGKFLLFLARRRKMGKKEKKIVKKAFMGEKDFSRRCFFGEGG